MITFTFKVGASSRVDSIVVLEQDPTPHQNLNLEVPQDPEKDVYTTFLRSSGGPKNRDLVWEFLQYLKSKYSSAKVYAHKAEHLYIPLILNCLIEHKEIVTSKSGLKSLRWGKAKIDFIDTYQFFRVPLDKMPTALKIPDPKLEHQTSQKYTLANTPKSINADSIYLPYMYREVKLLAHAYQTWILTYMHRTGNLKHPRLTVGQNSVSLFHNVFVPRNRIVTNFLPEFEIPIREAIYGGRNEVYTRYGENINFFDIKSMYVSCYDVNVPIGEMTYCKPRIESGVLAEATVDIPKSLYLGPLPVHYQGQFLFPVGVVKGWWDMRELRYAEEVGCTVKLHRQLTCEEAPILKEFGEMIAKLRKEPDPELSRLWKFLGLQLVGKFAQSRSRTDIVPYEKLETIIGAAPIDKYEAYFEVIRQQSASQANYSSILPAIAMRIRAEARIRHIQVLSSALKLGKIYYCDTDSVDCDADLPTGTNAGDLELEDQAKRAYFIVNKLYGYIDQKDVLRQRSSGFSGRKLEEILFQKLLDGGSVEFVGRTLGFGSQKDLLTKGLTDKHNRYAIRQFSGLVNRDLQGNESYPKVVSLNGS